MRQHALRAPPTRNREAEGDHAARSVSFGSRVAICTRVASLACRDSSAAAGAGGEGDRQRAPPPAPEAHAARGRLTVARTRPNRTVLAAMSVSVVWRPPVSAVGHGSRTRATGCP